MINLRILKNPVRYSNCFFFYLNKCSPPYSLVLCIQVCSFVASSQCISSDPHALLVLCNSCRRNYLHVKCDSKDSRPSNAHQTTSSDREQVVFCADCQSPKVLSFSVDSCCELHMVCSVAS